MNVQSLGRNDFCPCGSGKKFKRCCLSQQDGRSSGVFASESQPFSLFPSTQALLDPPTNSVDDHVIGTTAEHPFYVRGKGWTAAGQLKEGDLIRTIDGWVPVKKIEDSGRYETVYNLAVEDHRTYFVGAPEWGFGVWAHNTYKDVVDPSTGKVLKTAAQLHADVEAGLIAKGIDPALAKRITAEGAKPLADGNLLAELVQNGHITPATVVNLLAVPTGTGSATFSLTQLQKKFKHAADFGVSGPANKVNLAAFEAAMKAHLADPSVVAISGTYLKKPATLHVHPDTNLAVIVDGTGTFQSGWKLSPQQQMHGLILGRLGGH